MLGALALVQVSTILYSSTKRGPVPSEWSELGASPPPRLSRIITHGDCAESRDTVEIRPEVRSLGPITFGTTCTGVVVFFLGVPSGLQPLGDHYPCRHTFKDVRGLSAKVGGGGRGVTPCLFPGLRPHARSSLRPQPGIWRSAAGCFLRPPRSSAFEPLAATLPRLSL